MEDEERPPEFVLVREEFGGGDAQEGAELELEGALEAKAEVIIIEPVKLGDETARWITLGNFLHKAAVVSGFSSLVVGFKWKDTGIFYYPLGFISILCSSVYAISWQFDPCCKYQVEKDSRKLEKYNLPLHKLSSTSPVILVRRDDFRRKILQNLFSLAAAAFCSWKLYEQFYHQ